MFQTPIVLLQSENEQKNIIKGEENDTGFKPLSYYYSRRIFDVMLDKIPYLQVSNPYRITTVGEYSVLLVGAASIDWRFQTPIVLLQSENSPYLGL